MSKHRYCMHTLTIMPDDSVVVKHQWYEGRADVPGIPRDQAGNVSAVSSYLGYDRVTVKAQREQEAHYERYLRDRHMQQAEWRQTIRSAEKFLDSVLDDSQRAMWKKKRYITFVARSGHRYRLGQDGYNTIYWLDSRHRIRGELCAHPSYQFSMPTASIVAAQLLALSADEVDFIRHANLFSGVFPTFDESGKAVPPKTRAVKKPNV